MYERFVKRFLDLFFSSVALIVLAVPMACIALVIRLTDHGSVFFVQQRMGRNGQRFAMYKFRTMKADAPAQCPTHLLTHPERYITRTGAFLRRTSLDELPQILNIWKGQMSFVGPRPALCTQEDLLALRRQSGADRLRPGLTGWAQVNGRDRLDTAEKAHFDGEYRRRIGFLFDCKCVVRTVSVILRGDGADFPSARAVWDAEP